MTLRAAGLALLLVTTAALPLAAELQGVHHEPVACVAADRHARIAARGEPAGEVARAEVQFRLSGGSWYAAALAKAGAAWTGLLPRPLKVAAPIEYRIVMTSAGGQVVPSPAYPLRVEEDPSACPSPGETGLSSTIRVRVPEGAPLVPPVPAGFSPAGVVASQEGEPARSRKGLVLLGSAGVLGVIGTVVATNSETQELLPPDVPMFAFTGTLPHPQSTLSLSGDPLRVLMQMSHEPAFPLTLLWGIELRAAPAPAPVCLSMIGIFMGAQRPVGLVFTNPLRNTGACGDTYDVQVARLTVEVNGALVYDQTLPLPFHVVP